MKKKNERRKLSKSPVDSGLFGTVWILFVITCAGIGVIISMMCLFGIIPIVTNPTQQMIIGLGGIGISLMLCRIFLHPFIVY